MVLYGAENIEFIKPIPVGTKAVLQETVIDYQDKGKNAIYLLEAKVSNQETGELYTRTVT